MLATPTVPDRDSPECLEGRRDLVVRISGESGEGILSTGQLLAQSAMRTGLKVLTYFGPPAEIKGGYSWFQLRLSNCPIYTPGDSPDILIAFNQEAVDRDAFDLKPGGLLIYDPAHATSPDGSHRSVAIPLSQIAREAAGFELGKNVVALGVMGALCGLPPDQSERLLGDRFGRKGDDVLGKNLTALSAGGAWVTENTSLSVEFAIAPALHQPGDLFVSGNQAIVLGAMTAGLRFFAGYPITPASEIMELLATQLPRVGGACVQAEDEISAIGLALGAAFAGDRSMTATSGPGLSLMVEMLGLATMAELPVVVVDVQRAGPSTGMPTRHEQGDLMLAAFGGHGEVARVVIAPTSVSDCFYQAFNAINYAEKYQLPVIVLSDQSLAVRTENVLRPNLAGHEIEPRAAYSPGVPDYRRYVADAPGGVSPMSRPGEAGGEYTATGLEHNEYGRPRYDAATHQAMTRRRLAKLTAIAADAPPALRHGDVDAPLGLVTWGSTAGPAIEAIDQARERGIRVEMLAPRLLRPLPDSQIEPFLATKRVVVVAEANVGGQFADMLAARYRRAFRRLSSYTGSPVRSDDLLEAIVSADAALTGKTNTPEGGGHVG